MAPSPASPDPPPSTVPERPFLLNEKFSVQSYDGSSFKNRAQYDVKNALIPIIEPFHCSGNGTKFNLVLQCSEDFTLTHFYVSGPGPRCTEPIRSGLVWVTDQQPEPEKHEPTQQYLKKFDTMSSEEIMEVMKGLRTCGSDEVVKEGSALPDPCVYFKTDHTSREAEVELPKWREGRYVVIKFLDTHKDQVNIDVGVIGIVGFFGRQSKRQVPLGPWMRRSVRQIWVHPSPLKSMFSSSGWVCDGRDFTGGCRSGQTDFHQTNVYTVTFRCTTSGFDLCEACAYDPSLGKVTDASLQADLEALADPAMCKLAVTRLRNQWRRNWPETLPRYFARGLLDTMVQALHKSTDSSGRPDEDRAASQRQLSGAESQKRQARRSLMQLTTELTHRLLRLGPGSDVGVNDLVWALCPEPEEHWEEGRVLQLPKVFPDALCHERWCSSSSSAPAAAPAADDDEAGAVALPADVAEAAAEPGPVGDGADAGAPADPAVGGGGPAAAAAAGAPEGDAAADGAAAAASSCYLISWRDMQTPGRVQPRNVWKMTADEDSMMATAGLAAEVQKGDGCDVSKVEKFIQQGADLMAANGEGCPILLAAVRATASVETVVALLSSGACPDATGREGVTPLQQASRFRDLGVGEPGWAQQVCEALLDRGAEPLADAVAPSGAAAPAVPADRLAQLRETFGRKMVGALLTLQSPLSLPLEVLEVLQLLLRELPLEVVRQSLEPQAFRALTALLQHFVGGTDSLSTALVGCRIMRALCSRGDPELRQLVTTHGALRWARRLSSTKDIAQCGLYRQHNHEKVTPEELCRDARALIEEILAGRPAGEAADDAEDWRTNVRLAEAADALVAVETKMPEEHAAASQEALMSFRELLKKTEKGNLNEDRCAAYELERAGVPGSLLKFLKHHTPAAADPIRQPALDQQRWASFKEVFSEQTKQTRKGLARLMKALHAVIETGEAFPVWRHKRERGLRSLTEPVMLKLRHLGYLEPGPEGAAVPYLPQAMRSQVSVLVEPLASVGELSRYLLRVTPTADERYLAYCHRLVGASIRDKASGELATVMSFEVLHSSLPLPIHTVRREPSGDVHRVLLGVADYRLASPLPAGTALLDFMVALRRLHVVAGTEAYHGMLADLDRRLGGQSQPAAEAAQAQEQAPDPAEGSEAADAAAVAAEATGPSEAVRQALEQVVAAAASLPEEALAALGEERARVAPSGRPGAAEAGSADENVVDPTMRVHTVMIAVSDEIPFELFWPMVRDDIVAAVRELFPRGVPGMEEAVQAGVTRNGMGPVAQRLTLEEAETLAARVGHVVQTAVTVDQSAVQEAQKERAKAAQAEAISVGSRAQFSPKSGENWVPCVVVGHGPPTPPGGPPSDKFDVVDDQGVLWEQLPKPRVRVPPGRREASSSAGTPIQAILSQADLVRIREHLRRRQEEVTERHAHGGLPGAGALGAGGGAGSRPDSASAGAAAAGGGAAGADPAGQPATSRPTSAPAAVAQRPRASSAGAIEGGGGGRRISSSDVLSRDGSLGEVDPSGALEMVHFIEEEGIGDEEFDDEDGGPRDPGDDGEEDDEDLPPLEHSEGDDGSQGDAMAPPRLGIRGGPGDGDGPASMEEELRVLEQLRAMEQIISEVLDPHEASGASGRARRGEGGGHAEDFLSVPMANFRIRGAGGNVETIQFRRAGDSRGSQRSGAAGSEGQKLMAIRGDFPSFMRAADSNNPTSSLDHPVVERLGASDLVEEDASMDDPVEPEEPGIRPPQPSVRFCIRLPAGPASPAAEPATPSSAAAAAAAAGAPAGGAAEGKAQQRPPSAPPPRQPRSAPVLLPPSWNILKAMQFLQDQQHLRSLAEEGGAASSQADAAAAAAGVSSCVVQALQKVQLEGWCLGYCLAATELPADGDASAAAADEGGPMEVDAPAPQEHLAATRSSPGSAGALPAKKRRRVGGGARDEVAREMYSRFTAESTQEGSPSGPARPHELIARCGDHPAVSDALELMHLLKAQGPSLGIDPSLWVSSKLDRKLRYQLEDPLSVVSGTLPRWAMVLPRLCPFLFNLKTRKMLLKYTAFGPSFAVHWTQESKVGSFLRRRATVQTELNSQNDPRKIQELSQELSNIEEHVVKSNFWLGTLQSTLVRMTKGEELLRQSDVAMEFVASAGNLVEVQFDGETGFGSAVTQSFYVEVAQALQDRAVNKSLPMWVEDDGSSEQQYLLCRRGLLLKPLVDGPQKDEVVKRFRFLGRLMGQALREGFIVPLPLAEEFFALVLGESLGQASLPRPGSGCAGELVGALAEFARELGAGEAALATPEERAAWRKAQAERMDFAERFLTAPDRPDGATAQQATSFEQYVSAVGACFLETGLSGAPLCPGGDNVAVTVENVREFADQAARFWFDTGVSAQVAAWRAGINDTFPFECLVAFSRSELREMFCGEDRIEWDEQALLAHLHPVGGLSEKSPTYKYLVADLLEMNQADRSRFLDFVSSCPRLPPGGIAKFHVDVFPDANATKEGFPRSRACANQLYLPPYSSREELHAKLHEAMQCSAGHHEQTVRSH